MYVPAHFAADSAEVARLLDRPGAVDLVTATPTGLVATTLPMLHDPEPGPHGALVGHVARANDHWRQEVHGDALVVVRGPDAYVSPSWYPSKAEGGQVVPTWNYVAAHVYGALVVHDDVAWCEALVRRLTDAYEAGRPHRWSVDDAPAAFVAGMVKAIVGIEVRITRIEAKAKSSQNRPASDVDGVIAGLMAQGDHAAADAVRRAHQPSGLRGVKKLSDVEHGRMRGVTGSA